MNLKVKPEVLVTDFQSCDPRLLIVLGYFVKFCKEHDLPCLITSVKDKAKGRKSTTHLDGRAFDASVGGWDLDLDLEKCKHYMRKFTGHFGAYSKSDGKCRVLVFHDVGSGPHLHFQVSR